jgi:hypothetical protein
MIGIQFITQHLVTKDKVMGNVIYFPEMTEQVEILISANRKLLLKSFTNHRVFVFTFNVED